LRGDVIDFDAISPPTPDRYILKYRLKSLMEVRGNSPVYSSPGFVHKLELRLPDYYPEYLTNQDIRFLTPPIFHTNVFSDGRICIRNYRPAESLAYFLMRIARMIQFDPAIVGEDSPANGEALSWYRAHKHMMPIDATRLPEVDGAFVPGRVTKAFRSGTIVKEGS